MTTELNKLLKVDIFKYSQLVLNVDERKFEPRSRTCYILIYLDCSVIVSVKCIYYLYTYTHAHIYLYY